MEFYEIVLGHKLPEDKKVMHTRNRELWYKITLGDETRSLLYIPDVDILRVNVKELEACSEAIVNYDTLSIDEIARYRWDDAWIAAHSLSYGALSVLQNLQDGTDVACDIETRDLRYDGNKVLAIGFCFEYQGEETILTLTEADISKLSTLQKLQRIFARKFNFIWHNGKFDTEKLKFLLDIDARVDDDTLLMHYVGINEKRGTQGLKYLGGVYVQAPPWEDELQEYKRKWCRQNGVKLADFTYDMIPVDVLLPYLRCDVLATYRLAKRFRELMRPQSKWIYSKLIEASNVFRKIELNGIRLDLDYAKQLQRELTKEGYSANRVVQGIIAEVWNPDKYCEETGARKTKTVAEFSMKSPKKLRWLLSELVGFQVQSTDKEAIEQLLEHVDEVKDERGRKFLESLAIVRKADKYLDTYAVGLQKLCCADGRIRCTYNLHGTETGRLSASDPNMQQIPRDKKIKNLIVCDPGHVLINMDMSQAEIRTLAAVTGDVNLAEAYYEDKDLHATMAEKIFGPGWTKEQRSMVKTVTFGLIYGRGPAAIASAFGLKVSAAKQLIDDWFKAAPEAKKWIYEMKQLPFSGEEYVTPFGRTRHYVITEDNKWHISNEAVNMPIQSIASDITLMSIIDIQHWLEDENMEDVARIVATVHDSIVLEVEDDPDIIRKVIRVGKAIMGGQTDKYKIGPIKVPFKADAEYGVAYGSMKEVEL